MQESYLSLPPRNNAAKTSTVLTNVYEIRTERFASKYYHYPILPNSSPSRIIAAHLNDPSIKDSLGQRIGFVCFYKRGLLGSIQLSNQVDLDWRGEGKGELRVVMG